MNSGVEPVEAQPTLSTLKGPMKIKTLLVVVTSLVLAAASERTHMGYKVTDMQFPIAGGKTVSLPVTDAGPIPAENEAFKIEAAGVGIQPSIVDPKQANLSWGFSLTSKASKSLEHVLVEEVYPTEVAKVIVDDRSPSLKDQKWFGSPAGIEPGPSTTAWLFAEEGSVFVFRFTITPVGSRPVVLYQPVWLSQSSKAMFRQAVARINKR